MTYQRPHIVLDRDTEKVIGLIVVALLLATYIQVVGASLSEPHITLGKNFLQPDLSSFNNHNAYSILCAVNMPTWKIT